MALNQINNGDLGSVVRATLNSLITQANTLRTALTANTTYFVSTTGNNSNNGTSSGTAWLTIGHAMTVLSTLDFAGFNVTVQLADGTYNENVTVPVTVGQVNSGALTIKGNTATPANVVVAGQNAFVGAFNAPPFTAVSLTGITVNGFATNGYGIVSTGGSIVVGSNMVFGAAGFAQWAAVSGGQLQCSNNYTISGNSANHWSVVLNAALNVQNITITLTGTPAFSTAFANAEIGGVMQVNGNTFSGAATGTRYNADSNGAIQTFGGGATYLPGNAAGTTASGGQYA